MGDPQQSWNQPGQQPWGQQPPQAQHLRQQTPPQQWYPQQGQPSWGAPPAPAEPTTSSTALLVLGLVTAVVGVLGAFLPSATFPDDTGSYSPLLQTIGEDTYFQAPGLVLLAGAAVVVAGALVQRRRAGIGTGLILAGSSVLAQYGLVQMLGRLQGNVTGAAGPTVAVGGVLLMIGACTAVATVVVGLVRLSRLR